MPSTNYYVLKGTSEKIYTDLCNNKPVDNRVFDIWLQAMVRNIENDQLNNIPTEVDVLRNYLASRYFYIKANEEQNFAFGAIYGSLQLLSKAKRSEYDYSL